MTFKTSLIIPTWNAEKTVKDCLISALTSNIIPDEIIVVDDFSTDQTCKIVEEISHSNKNVRLYKLTKNLGPAAARDFGARKAIGDILFFTDSDTLILNNSFVNCLKTIDNYNADAVSGIYHPQPINDGMTQLYKALFFYYQFARHSKPFIYETFNGQIAAIKKEVYLKTGGYNRNISWGIDNENEEFGRRIIKDYKLLLDPSFQVKHNFPGFKKLTNTYFFRVSTWIYIFMKDLKFESGGPASVDSGLAALSALFLIISFFVGVFLYKAFILLFLIFTFIWLYGYLKFFIYVLKTNKTFLLSAILLNLWFSCVISLGAFWGLCKWIFGKRVKN